MLGAVSNQQKRHAPMSPSDREMQWGCTGPVFCANVPRRWQSSIERLWGLPKKAAHINGVPPFGSRALTSAPRGDQQFDHSRVITGRRSGD